MKILVCDRHDIIGRAVDALAMLRKEDETPKAWHMGHRAAGCLLKSLGFPEVCAGDWDDNEFMGLPWGEMDVPDSSIILEGAAGTEIRIVPADFAKS